MFAVRYFYQISDHPCIPSFNLTFSSQHGPIFACFLYLNLVASHFAYTLTLNKSRFSYLFASEVVWKLVTGHMEDLFPCVDGSQYHLQGVDELISVVGGGRFFSCHIYFYPTNYASILRIVRGKGERQTLPTARTDQDALFELLH